jgi:excinuclease ABC subunit A
MRLLFARIGHPHCPLCGREIARQSKDQITNSIYNLLTSHKEPGKKPLRLLVLAPLVKDRKGEYQDLFAGLRKRGYRKVRVDGRVKSLDDDFVLIKTNKHTIELVIDAVSLTQETDRVRIATDVEQALQFGDGEMIVSLIKDASFDMPEDPREMEDILFSEKFACPVDNISLPEVEPRIFSFNTPHGACPECSGIGNVLNIDKDLVFNDNLSINEGGILPFFNLTTNDTWFSRTFKTFCQENGIPLDVKLGDMAEDKKDLLVSGTGEREYEVDGENRWGSRTSIREAFRGLSWELKRRYNESESQFVRGQIEKFMRYDTCPACKGSRLKKEALSVTIEGKSIMEVSTMPIGKALAFVNSLKTSLNDRETEIAKLILREITERLKFLVDVGLEYLTLSRTASTLAGGEAQRIRLASQIGSGLTGVLYVLDEPSIGLHQRDNTKLIETLKKLRDLGNTVLVVEHEEETMQASDYIYDFGPGAGIHGGQIVAQGTIDEIKNDDNSLTGQYLSGKKQIHVPSTNGLGILTEEKKEITLKGARANNLKGIDVTFPLHKLVVVTGVSGSGKSTLVNDILYHAIMQKQNPFHRQKPGLHDSIEGDAFVKNVFAIDQSPIGRTPRSNPATYTGAFSYIRDIFASTKEAKMRGYGPGRFSFNVRGGRCEACEGEGQIKIEMQFLPDVYIQCDVCRGKQYNNEALEVLFNEKSIADILDMSVSEAKDFFSFVPGLHHRMETLHDVGLGYIGIGQPAPTLSGGEAQRVKLATELSKRGRDALYILDEPTTGLHFADLEKLLYVLRRLVDQGNSVIIIEHNLDIIKNADYIIDLGPEGGENGGTVVATGTPAQIAGNEKSHTGTFLKKVL